MNIQYRKDIDGLRAIAVLLVLFTHLEFSYFSGGFVGVDIFFVISGYLITSILIKDINENKFSLINFYEKRIRRIFPALFGVVLISSLIGYFILLPDDYKNFGQSIAATSLFSSNILFWQESNYFDTASKLKPLLHTWSLGVEEQFYLFLPLILILVFKFFKTKLTIVILSITFVSFILSIYGAYYKPSTTFYLIPTRAWELLAGSILALNLIPKSINININTFLSFIGLIFITISVLLFDEYTIFPGLSALLPVSGVLLLIYSGNDKNFISNILSIKPIIFTGLISYSLYLWHWPLIVFYKYYIINPIMLNEKILLLITSIIIAILSWHFIEKPFRNRNLFWNRKRIFIFSFISITITFSFGYFLHKTQGYSDRLNNNIRNDILANEKAQKDWQFPVRCDNFKVNPNKIEDIKLCKLGNKRIKDTLIWGDSHIEMYFPSFRSISNKNPNNHNFTIATSGGCLPIRGYNQIKPGYFCNEFNNLIFKEALKPNYKRIIIGSKWDYYGNGYTNISKDILAIDSIIINLKNDIKILKEKNKEVILILPTHRYEKSPAIQIQKVLLFKKDHIDNYIKEVDLNINYIRKKLKKLIKEINIQYIDPYDTFCKKNKCIYQLDNISIFKDDDHLNSKGALMLENKILGTLK